MKTKKQVNFSQAHKKYIKRLKQEKILVVFLQIFILALLLGLWELLAHFEVIDPFFFSSPSRVIKCIASLIAGGEIWMHMGISLAETVIGFIVATLLGAIIAILLWWSEQIGRAHV